MYPVKTQVRKNIKKLKPITANQTEHLTVDENGKLYWKGKRIAMMDFLGLEGRIMGWTIALSAAIATTIALLNYLGI